VSVKELARRLHVGKTTVYKRLGEAGTKMRPSRVKYRHILTEECLRDLYVDRKLRAQTVAEKVGCSIGSVYNHLRRNKIPLKRPRRAT